MRVLMMVCCLVASVGAQAGTQTLCDAMTPERNAIGCRVAYIDGMGDTLLIRVHAKKDDPSERVATAKAETRRVIDSFLATGGVFIKMRSTRSDGATIERTCSKVKGRKTEHCGEWAPVES